MSQVGVVGTRILVFDAATWERVGHDVGDNAVFWKPATVHRARYDVDGELLYDVIFDEQTVVSYGHFATSTRALREEA